MLLNHNDAKCYASFDIIISSLHINGNEVSALYCHLLLWNTCLL